HAGPEVSVAFSRDGQLILNASLDGTAKVWYAQLGGVRETLSGNASVIISAAFLSKDRVITGAVGGGIREWDVSPRSAIHSFQVEDENGDEEDSYVGASGPARFLPGGSRVLSMSDKGVSLWDTVSGRLLASTAAVSDSFAISPNGQLVFVGGGET